jgi:membrane protein DedA with SNARE-associated domain
MHLSNLLAAIIHSFIYFSVTYCCSEAVSKVLDYLAAAAAAFVAIRSAAVFITRLN